MHLQSASAHASSQRVWLHAIFFVVVASWIFPVCCLTLEAGQRIAPRLDDSLAPFMTLEGVRRSLFDLRLVERWAEARDLKEHHLKTIYQIVMKSDENLEESLVAASFPCRHAADLLSQFDHSTSRLVETRPSASGGKKLVVELSSGRMVETVLIRHDTSRATRYTVCVSSQVGCARACSFCATGTLGLQADLSSAEILEQVWIARSVLEDPKQLRNCVFMGMGEPLDNWPAVHEACRGLTHQCLFGFKAKHVTISTVGASPERIRLLADEAPQVSLAISLHGATQSLREELMPAARRASLTELEGALDYHAQKTGQGVMVEYLLIDGVNDSAEASRALVRFCLARQIKPYVNLIPYNPTIAGVRFGYKTPSDDCINAFHMRLRSEGIQSLVRWTSAAGRDAVGACGQLALSIAPEEEGNSVYKFSV